MHVNMTTSNMRIVKIRESDKFIGFDN
jgi:hypothetical protein